ncbi:MAG: hypothetical protein ACOYNQ_03830 [Burkholderiales bacterium]
MLLLITGSSDGTGDLITSKLGNRVFRFNYDLYQQYDFEFRPDFWEIRNPTGHLINSSTVSSAFWWKAFNFPLKDEDNLIVEEVKYIFRELYHCCRLSGITKGNSYDFHNRLGKLNLLNIASKYFETPSTLATFRLSGVQKMIGIELVAKSFSSALTDSKAALMTTAVKPNLLNPNFPWYLQEKITSDADITVFVCGDNLFAYERDRGQLKGLDWRAEQTFDAGVKEWIRFDLKEKDSLAIGQFCKDISVDWGRLDFMRRQDELVFLEFNANGQWVFLDYDGRDGLLDCAISYIAGY